VRLVEALETARAHQLLEAAAHHSQIVHPELTALDRCKRLRRSGETRLRVDLCERVQIPQLEALVRRRVEELAVVLLGQQRRRGLPLLHVEERRQCHPAAVRTTHRHARGRLLRTETGGEVDEHRTAKQALQEIARRDGACVPARGRQRK
jgi:ParB-like chromosome segregation protein Spo0J